MQASVWFPLPVPRDDLGVRAVPPQPDPGRHLQRPELAVGQPPQQEDASAEVASVRERPHAPRVLRQGGRDEERPQPHLHQHGLQDVQLEPRHAHAASGDAGDAAQAVNGLVMLNC